MPTRYSLRLLDTRIPPTTTPAGCRAMYEPVRVTGIIWYNNIGIGFLPLVRRGSKLHDVNRKYYV